MQDSMYTQINIPEPFESLISWGRVCAWECCGHDAFVLCPALTRAWIEVNGIAELEAAREQVLELIEKVSRLEGTVICPYFEIEMWASGWMDWLKQWLAVIEQAPSTPLLPPPEAPAPVKRPPYPKRNPILSWLDSILIFLPEGSCDWYLFQLIVLAFLVVFVALFWKLGWFPLQSIVTHP